MLHLNAAKYIHTFINQLFDHMQINITNNACITFELNSIEFIHLIVTYFYEDSKNKMIKITKLIYKKKIAITTKSNYLSIRNIYFIPFNRKIN